MQNLFFFLFFVALHQSAFSQTDSSEIYTESKSLDCVLKTEPHKDSNFVYDYLEFPASFIGGEQKLMEFISAQTRYPRLAMESNVQGKVVVTFVVEKDGSISNELVQKDLGFGCGEAALSAVKKMPKWKPGTMLGVPVRQSFSIPINFRLDNSTDFQDTQPAKYMGGSEALQLFLKKEVKIPKAVKRKKAHGFVEITIEVAKTGQLSNANIKNSSGNKALDKSVLTALQKTGLWQPALENGGAVDSRALVRYEF